MILQVEARDLLQEGPEAAMARQALQVARRELARVRDIQADHADVGLAAEHQVRGLRVWHAAG